MEMHEEKEERAETEAETEQKQRIFFAIYDSKLVFWFWTVGRTTDML